MQSLKLFEINLTDLFHSDDQGSVTLARISIEILDDRGLQFLI